MEVPRELFIGPRFVFGDLGEGSKKQEFALDLMKGAEGVILCLDVLIFLSGTQ